MEAADRDRLSVVLVDVLKGHEAEFVDLANQLAALIVRRKYGIAETIRDEADPLRFYAVRRWTDAAAAAACHADPEVQNLNARLHRLASVTHVVNGARPADPLRALLTDRRARGETDRRTGFDRRVGDIGRVEGDRRGGADRRVGPRRLHNRPSAIDLVEAARGARAHSPHEPVGAALETADGRTVTGCNIRQPALGLTICAERAALIRALTEGHRSFRRLVIFAEEEQPPCEACREAFRQLAPDIEVVLADASGATAKFSLHTLPSPKSTS
jgi:cytidine deaminase